MLFPGLGHGPFFSNTTPGGNFEAENPFVLVFILILTLVSFSPLSQTPGIDSRAHTEHRHRSSWGRSSHVSPTLFCSRLVGI